MRVLGISGSLRAASYNTSLLREAVALAPEGVEVELFEGLDRLPPYNEDHDTEDELPEVARLRSQIAASDAVLFATPEYNGALPGQLKHAVDWASRPYGAGSSLWGKPVAVVGASVTDYGAMWAQDQLRRALGIAGARVLEADLPIAKAQALFDENGELADEETRERLAELVGALVEHHHTLRAAA
jgi:chromate reductase, NAD(P)H dehydrogenase (quinone)